MGYSLSTDLNVEEIEINKRGDKIYVAAEDSTLFDRFVKCFDFIIRQSKIKAEELAGIEEKYSEKEDTESKIEMTVEMSRVNVEFSTESSKMIDGIFGDGTVKKYFCEHYEKIPDFVPGIDCFMEFLDKISPIMEDIFGKLIEGREAARRARMAKYQPQDHKKPQRKKASK